MDRTEFIRIRTDTALGFITNRPVDTHRFIKAIAEHYDDYTQLEKEDAALMAGLTPSPSQYKMRDLNRPNPVANIQLPDNLSYAPNRRFSTSYAQDWPQAHDDNPFGQRHPLSWDLPSCPLLHGAQWGDPHFVDHLMHLIEEDEDGHSIIHQMHERERMGIVPRDMEEFVGRPAETLKDLYLADRKGRHEFLSQDDYEDMKREQWNGRTSRLGMLSYLFGTEWQTPEQSDAFMGALRKLGGTQDRNEPEAKKIMNDFKGATGMSWERAKRNWFERMTPLARWWSRPQNRHGPVSSSDEEGGLEHYKSPWMKKDGTLMPSFSHHWWQPFQYGGGVGRDTESFVKLMRDSYPEAFNGWLGDKLLGILAHEDHPINDPEDAYHSSGSSFFPAAANDEGTKNHPHQFALSSGWEAGSQHPRTRSINNRRGTAYAVLNNHHLHPDEVSGKGGFSSIPSTAMRQEPIANIVQMHSDLGKPRVGRFAERHPADEEYWQYHNPHYEQSDINQGKMMQEMALKLMEQNPELFSTKPGDLRGLSIARGNIQQLAQAANYHLLRGDNPDYTSIAPTPTAGGFTSREVPLGAVHPSSQVTQPTTHLPGNLDAWGHKMPATLAYKWDRPSNSIRFEVKDKPFETLQTTVHENHVNMVSPTILNHPMQPKQQDVPALFSTNNDGYAPIVSGDLHKSDDDYEATGVFKTLINPAHTVYDIGSVDDLRGFTGNWVIQSRPEGKRVIISKSGSHISAHDGKGGDVSLPAAVKEGLRKQSGNCTFDGVLKEKHYRAIDLLVHKGDDIHMDPLEDRLSILRTLYETDEGISFPMPKDCKFTDREGLQKNIEAIGGEVWLRDATSTFMKGKEAHHKWVLYAPNGDITKSAIAYVSRVNDTIVLEYPELPPLVVKAVWDGNGLDLDIEESSPLAIHAEKQISLWGPVATHLYKYDIREITPYPPFIGNKTSMIFTRALLEPSGEQPQNAQHLIQARQHIKDSDTSFTTDQLLSAVGGLTEDMLAEQGAEYGLERTEDGEWTVNEAIDHEIQEKQGMNMARISGSMTGGGWSGAMDMLTAPRGPTELVDEEATPMFDPFQQEDGEQIPQPLHITLQTRDGTGEEIDGELDVQDGEAKLSYPRKTKREGQKEDEIKVPMVEEEKPEIPPPMPQTPQTG
jgi:hypothetical protein